MGGVRSAQLVLGAEDGCLRCSQLIDRPQVEPDQEPAERADGFLVAVAQRLAENLGEQQHRTDADLRTTAVNRTRREKGSYPFAQRMAGNGGVDQRVCIEGVHGAPYRLSRPARISAISSSAYSALMPPVDSGIFSASRSISFSRSASL